jgi:hypothetical protein
MNDNQDVIQNSATPNVPGAIGGPESGTGSIESISSISPFNAEKAPTDVETSLNYEQEPTYEKPKPPEQYKHPQDTEPEAPLLTKTVDVKPNVVDKSKGTTKLHHISNTHDKLTNLADTEEEEFITKVETAHEHK